MSTARLEKPEPLLASLTVADAMHRGIVTCSPLDDLREVATALAENAIHCVVVIDAGPQGEDDDRLWGVVSDIDLMRGLRSAVRLDAGNLAALEIMTVAPDDSLDRAAQLMSEHEIAHLVVIADDRPVGVISTLDIARAAAGMTR